MSLDTIPDDCGLPTLVCSVLNLLAGILSPASSLSPPRPARGRTKNEVMKYEASYLLIVFVAKGDQNSGGWRDACHLRTRGERRSREGATTAAAAAAAAAAVSAGARRASRSAGIREGGGGGQLSHQPHAWARPRSLHPDESVSSIAIAAP